MDDFILEMKKITKTFPGVKALDNVNLRVRRGEIHAICGESGAGKSTLMKVLSGVYPIGTYEGQIVYNGKTCEFQNIRDSEKAGIVIIHQKVCDDISITLRKGGNPRLQRSDGCGTDLICAMIIFGYSYGANISRETIINGKNVEPRTPMDTIGSCFIGALLMGVLNNGMSILGIDANWQKAVKGLVLLAAVVFDVLSKKRSRSN